MNDMLKQNNEDLVTPQVDNDNISDIVNLTIDPLDEIIANQYVSNSLNQINNLIETNQGTISNINAFFENGGNTKIMIGSEEFTPEEIIISKKFDFLQLDNIEINPKNSNILNISILAYHKISEEQTKETLFTTTIQIPENKDDIYKMGDRQEYSSSMIENKNN